MRSFSMKQFFKTLAVFLSIALCVALLCLLLNGAAPRIACGSVLPENISRQHYVISGLTYDEAAGGYPLHFSGAPKDVPLSLTLYFRLGELYQDGEKIAELSGSTTSQRTYSAELSPNSAGELNLLLKTSPATIEPGLSGYSLQTLFTRYAAQSPKLVLGPTAQAKTLRAASNNFYRILMGLYLMLVAACLVMFRRKPTEGYLLTVCVAAFFVLLYLLTAMDDGLLRFPYGVASRLSALTNILPVVCLAYTCVGLFPTAVPENCKKLFSPAAFFAVTAAALLIDLLLGVYIYQFMRRLMLFPVVVVLSRACARRLSGSRMIFVSYCLMEGIALFLYVNNSVMNLEYSPFLMFFRVKELSNLIFLSACSYQIFDRFSQKFLEADRLAAAVSGLNVALEQKVEERTAQLRWEQEQKHAMMLNVFHDLRSPIFVLKGRLASLRGATEEDGQSIAVMKERLHDLERLTEDLFLSAKLESGDIQYDQDLVDLSSLTRAVARDLAPAAAQKGVSLCCDALEAPLYTWGDSFRLQQAAVNLAENAVFYTPAGGSVHLSLRREGDRCLFAVADTGKGIRPEELSKVFDRYYRADQSNKHSSGLGLSIAKEIVTAHRGAIRVESTVGEGSVFTMILPACVPEPAESAERTEFPSGKSETL